MATSFAKDAVRPVLDDVALAIVARKQPVSGMNVIETLSGYGVVFSPGTLYPVLHDLAARGLIDVQEANSPEKLYTVADADAVDERLEAATRELLSVAEFVADETPTAEHELEASDIFGVAK